MERNISCHQFAIIVISSVNSLIAVSLYLMSCILLLVNVVCKIVNIGSFCWTKNQIAFDTFNCTVTVDCFIQQFWWVSLCAFASHTSQISKPLQLIASALTVLAFIDVWWIWVCSLQLWWLPCQIACCSFVTWSVLSASLLQLGDLKCLVNWLAAAQWLEVSCQIACNSSVTWSVLSTSLLQLGDLSLCCHVTACLLLFLNINLLQVCFLTV